MQPVLHQRMPAPDARLRLAMEMAEGRGTCADIGADHGRLSLALLAQGRAQHVLVTDISEKSLRKARVLLQSHGLEGQATFAAADGLSALDALGARPIQTIFILGMGGDTLRHILLEGSSRLQGAELILGAQTELAALRQAVCGAGYRIRREEIAQEGGRSYVLMRCTPAMPQEPGYSPEQLLLGPMLLNTLPPEWQPLLQRRQRLLEQQNAAMEKAPRDQSSLRLQQSRQELAYVLQALKRYEAQKGTGEAACQKA